MKERSDTHALFCLSCGYDLRGLQGDPIRCPECGRQNLVEDLQIPGALVSKQLRSLETMPTLAVLGMFGSAAGLFIVCVGRMPFGTLLLVFAPLLWVYAIWRFARSCSSKRGWANVLMWFHLTAICWLGIWALVCIVLFVLVDAGSRSAVIVLAAAALTTSLLGPLLGSGKRRVRFRGPYWLAQQKLRSFGLELAVELAKREMAARGPDGVKREERGQESRTHSRDR